MNGSGFESSQDGERGSRASGRRHPRRTSSLWESIRLYCNDAMFQQFIHEYLYEKTDIKTFNDECDTFQSKIATSLQVSFIPKYFNIAPFTLSRLLIW
jgi:hypothetical protein